MSKKWIVVPVVLSLSFLSAFTVLGKENKVMKLKAEPGSEVILKKVEYRETGDGEGQVTIEGRATADGIIEAYQIQIDTENGTYITKPLDYELSKEEKEEFEAELSYEKGDSIENKLLAAKSYYKGWLRASTEDPVRIETAASKISMSWSEDIDGLLECTSSTFNTWAANPSEFDTHWYKNGQSFPKYTYNSDNSKITQTAWAAYYNYDFGNDNLRTDVKHNMTMIPVNKEIGSGQFDYKVTMDKSGEASALLQLNVTTN
ncbi:hypothetical protein BAG01nite_45240 [Brevibacillus agri]|uniref:Uncharacterized protein n=1 Tax=Brevibacillus agri TaxID=51101 RepID=A0A3M8AHP8_9BACL|nr:hypothetical protein [Brevibacillus agri]MED4571346.1 hypothetical protein [Brevibacillus agri]QAV11638.1 hypothetical protein BA6348_01875 [Brevibacillus agri]RNB50732.1 hypothetical protein EB820_21130 [Brevibacillus agri]GED28422.1 hypothetical protein BAG01nite_45240 [Brevibacillus agri]